jgi:Fic-DOC domain mobile mystery protein B
MKFVYPEGATPFTTDDSAALIPGHIRKQEELNEWEQLNILQAEKWLFMRKRKDIASIHFIVSLHKKMFDQTWEWAGQYRRHQTNIGVEPFHISMSLTALCGDVQYWIGNQTFNPVEIAVRFHHRLVAIHPFPNGNGRLSRLVADALLFHMQRKRLSWGRISLSKSSDMRKEYIRCLREADAGNYLDLINFALS